MTEIKQNFSLHENSKYWNYEKNHPIIPSDILTKVKEKYWFCCFKCNHTFLSFPKSAKCLYCANQELCNEKDCQICFQKSFASHERSKQWSSRNQKNPRNVFKGTPKKYWFKCDKCPHEFETTLNGITGSRGRKCMYCQNQRLCKEKDCKYCFDKSLATHEMSKQWSDRNGKTKPWHVFKSSDSKKYWFFCKTCPHEFQKDCYHITSQDSNCPYCAKSNGTLCEEKDCDHCFNRSLASIQRVKNQWSSRNTVEPRTILKGRDREKYWINCDQCSHEFASLPKCLSIGQWCPFCCLPPKQLCAEEDCKECYDKRFTRHEKSNYWSSRNDESHSQVFICSGKSYWFNCKDCNREFKMQIASITSKGTWCPYCVRKTEKKMLDFLQQHFNTIHQFRQDWCKNPETGHRLPFDFCIPELDIIIELDGLQHFIQVMNWRAPDFQQDLDYYKQVQANNNGYSVIRILQPDVYYDRYDWTTELLQTIEKIRNSDTVENFYLCKNEEYSHLIN